MPMLSKSATPRKVFSPELPAFLQSPPQPAPMQLDPPEHRAADFLPSLLAPRRSHPFARLGRYISAGGMRDLRPDWRADVEHRQRRLVIRFLLAVLTVWVIFLLVPCR